MNKNKTIKPCNYITRFFFYRPIRVLKPLSRPLVFIFLLVSLCTQAQNKLQKQVSAAHIKTISINGNEIFNILVSSSKRDDISVTSILDGEYQNDFQVAVKAGKNTLILSLEHVSLSEISDDKRNAHKVIAATLEVEIPEQLSLTILSDIGSVAIKGNFSSLFIELEQGHCDVEGEAKTATINTIDGAINVRTKSASVKAKSNHGIVVIDTFSDSGSIWDLKSINGNITVAKQE